MALTRVPSATRSDGSLPDDLYIAFVDDLLVDVDALFFSSLVVTIAQLVAAYAAQSAILWLCATLSLIVCAFRLWFMGMHARQRPSANVAAARRQERIYAIGAVASLTALSFWTFLAFYASQDSFARLIGTTMTIAYAFGMLTRSFATYRGMDLLLVAGFTPIAAGLVAAGGWYPAGILVGLLPLVVFAKGSSLRIRANFLSVIDAQNQMAVLAKRLDMALNNMSHGLMMIDAKGHVPVANRQLLNLLRLGDDDLPTGASLRTVARTLMRRKIIAQSEIERVWKALAGVAIGRDMVAPFETRDDRAIVTDDDGAEGADGPAGLLATTVNV